MARPRIACFHGGGSNAQIFEIQCAFLSTLLSDTFDLQFFDGPFDRSAGPGVLPAFEGYAPYHSWFDTAFDRPDGSGYDNTGKDGVERAWRLMEERSREKKGGEWVGVMGFSQGTRMAGGLLLDQQNREKDHAHPGGIWGNGGVGNGSGTRAGEGIKLKFGVLCVGGGPPMESEVAYKLPDPDTIVRIPTLHMHGLKDEFLPLGREQYKTYYERGTATLYEIDYHHAMPWVKSESEELARLIKELYERTK